VIDTFSGTVRSYLAVAWYTSGETDNETAGWVKSIPAEWENNDSDTVTITINKPTRDGVVLQVNHYDVYYQEAASFTLGSASFTADSVVEANETATTVELVVTGLTDSNAVTFAAAATNVATTDGLLINMKGQPRANISRAADGTVNRKSFAKDVTFDIIDLLFTVTTVSQADWQQLLFWMKYGVPIKLTDSSTDKYITDYYGSIMAVDDPGTEGKNTAFDFPLQFMVEYETES